MVKKYVGTDGNDFFRANPTNESWHLAGEFGNDTLYGGDKNDTLHGGGYSHDSLIGGKGDDTYYIDSYSDRIVEKANEGNDTVFSRISHTLGSTFENLYLIPDERATHGTGNDKSNYIYGGYYGNVLNGMKGNDTVDGAGGHDIIQGSNGGGDYRERDTLIGGSGVDRFILGTKYDKFYDNGGYNRPLA